MPPALHLSGLPAPQREAWRRLTPTREDFVLYGGTAVALHAAHRESVDFDFFSSLEIDGAGKRALRRRLDIERAPVTQDEKNTLGVRLDTDAGPVLLSFFGGLPHPRLAPPLAAADGPRVASRLDLAGFKAAMTYQRHEENDAADLAALLAAGETLPRALAAMQIFRQPVGRAPRPPLLDRRAARPGSVSRRGALPGQAARIAARFPPPSFAGRGTPPPRTPPRSALRADERSPDFLHRLLSGTGTPAAGGHCPRLVRGTGAIAAGGTHRRPAAPARSGGGRLDRRVAGNRCRRAGTERPGFPGSRPPVGRPRRGGRGRGGVELATRPRPGSRRSS